VATLVAARRRDVSRLASVAGNLDPRARADLHRISPLDGSLDPVDHTEPLQKIRLWHFVGEQDTNLPPALALSYANRFAQANRPNAIVVSSLAHHQGWVAHWPDLWRSFLSTQE
jgi:hypothetical protein